MTKPDADTNALFAELVALLRLTRTEAKIARIRVSQAKDDSFRRELLANADNADKRALRIQNELRRLGGTPDVVGDAVGRVVALAKVITEQLQPLSEGLLGDLVLEHQLRDRAIFTRVLAEAHDVSSVTRLMKELEAAHTKTIEWIRLRLAELAQGGSVALAPTPPQVAAGVLARFAMLPTRQSSNLVNKLVNAARRGNAKVQESADTAITKVRQTAEATGEVVEAGRDAALARTEKVAPNAGVRRVARQTRTSLGTVDAEALPIAEYDALTRDAAIKEIRELQDSDDLRMVLRYEEAHQNRKAVTNAADRQLTELAERAVEA
jgi:hypothetical protein